MSSFARKIGPNGSGTSSQIERTIRQKLFVSMRIIQTFVLTIFCISSRERSAAIEY
uniref:AlNc14C2G262 protein n=1 Tax=Albugo laibachii Nc14 TaxID=890382 RepID=F0VZC4_9STRA|nr:AlNc14C2G262 [Albugo laibachii Nc14]|eukprot:CCA14154.1 AlNc14C2G262 [Albugo laibachii Nc14]